jgi:ubiquinone/menaquinone biosynthesis C-methylase UbiE
VDGEAFKDFEAAGWSANADGYDRLTGRITGRMTAALLDAAAAPPGGRLLDVGCGPGHLCAAAAERGLSATGVDLAAGMVERAARSHPEIEFRRADAEDLPFADATFDAVVGAFVVNHLPRPERGAAELRRVLRPGGRLVLAMWDAPERVALFGLLEEAMRRARVEAAAALPAGPAAHRFADPGELRALLEGADLAAVELQEHEFAHEVGDAAELWDGVATGSVRTAAQLRALGDDERRRVRRALEDLLAERGATGGVRLDTVVRIAAGVAR